MMTANNLLSTKVNHAKLISLSTGSEHVRSGERLPDTAALLQKRSVSNATGNLLGGQKIRENKIYATRDDQNYYTSNKVLTNHDPAAKNSQQQRKAQSNDFAGALSRKNADKFVNRNSNEHERLALPSYLRLHEKESKF